ncbi:NAD(P)-binding protein [Saccharata proteae CBS 121410]|uniref:NAD(P)-binding protein n=1 Tax=Saccharata proteae CBS 121410 TaxID=1314787 RepID=A0A9P4LTB5_9PEZI|nr:NAD(P)-binding protein [Saccharata proteae CBS 121410]
MTILLTGGTGKTSTAIASLLRETNDPYILASRKPAASTSTNRTTRFDWLDRSTWLNPFTDSASPISAIYLVAPETSDPATPMNALVDFARNEHGVKRFVLMAGSSAKPGNESHHVGRVWQHLKDVRESGGGEVGYVVLRPSWFMENLVGPGHRDTITHMSAIYTACGEGKIPFVSVVDIARVAVNALRGKAGAEADYRILGPELLTYDEVAETVGRVLGKEVRHVKLGDEEREKGLVGNGVNEGMAKFLVWLEASARRGEEELGGNDVESVTGKRPGSLEEFARASKGMWAV